MPHDLIPAIFNEAVIYEAAGCYVSWLRSAMLAAVDKSPRRLFMNMDLQQQVYTYFLNDG